MRRSVLLAIGLVCSTSSVSAAGLRPDQELCIKTAARYYYRPGDPVTLQGFVDLIHAVRFQENGCGQKVLNKNGTWDLGCMQINTSHLPVLQRFGITEEKLRYSDCQNIVVGVWILHTSISTAPDLWTGVGNYNTGPGKRTPERVQKNLEYQRHVWRRLQTLWAQRVAGR
jgi:hypothetical protein